MQSQPDEWLTITEACDYLKITKPTLLKLRKDGRIKEHYPGGVMPGKGPQSGGANKLVRFKKSELDSMMGLVGHGD